VTPTAKSLILDLLSTTAGAAIPVRALVQAGAIFGLGENGVRVELARLFARGVIERDERGSYRVAARAAAVQSHVRAWARVEERMTPWTGGWIGVHTGALKRSDRRAARQRRRAFDFLGFRELDPGLWIRPDNLRGGVADVRRQLEGLGLDAVATIFALGALDDATEARARRLWDVAALRAAYRRLRAAIAASERRIPRLAAERAMVETFTLGGRVIRQLVLDPLLPQPIVPAAERRALLDAMRRYDRVGRDCWSPFMRTHGAPSRRSPTNSRPMPGDGNLAVAAGGLS